VKQKTLRKGVVNNDLESGTEERVSPRLIEGEGGRPRTRRESEHLLELVIGDQEREGGPTDKKVEGSVLICGRKKEIPLAQSVQRKKDDWTKEGRSFSQRLQKRERGKVADRSLVKCIKAWLRWGGEITGKRSEKSTDQKKRTSECSLKGGKSQTTLKSTEERPSKDLYQHSVPEQ